MDKPKRCRHPKGKLVEIKPPFWSNSNAWYVVAFWCKCGAFRFAHDYYWQYPEKL